MGRSLDLLIVFWIRMEHGEESRSETRKVSKERESEMDGFGGRSYGPVTAASRRKGFCIVSGSL